MTRPTLILAGSGGPIARAVARASRDGYDVIALTRNVDGGEPDGTRAVAWNPRAARQDDVVALEALAGVLDGAKAVVNLAGTSIDGGRMGAEHARRLVESRVDATTTLVRAVERAGRAPEVWIQGSASGYYGTRGDEALTEAAAPGEGFLLADVARAWEDAARPAASRCRMAVIRPGVVLAHDAPAWHKLILPIRLFVGGPLGSGDQWLPWIGGDDLGRAVRFLVEHEDATGPFNLVAPEPVRQKDFARRAAARLGRPAWFPAPAPLLRVVLGRAADQLLLPSQRLVPARLLELGFAFERPTLDRQLDALLGG